MSAEFDRAKPWRLRLLGGISFEGREEFATRRSKLLLVRLALARGGAITRDEATRLLWPDDYVDAARPRLRQEVSRLRLALGPAAEIVVGDRERLWLAGDRVEIDFVAWEAALRQAKSHEDFVRAGERYGGEFAPGLDESWIVSPREEFRRWHVESLILRSEMEFKQGDLSASLATARTATAIHPLDEDAHFRVLLALRALGQSVELRTTYERAKNRFLTSVGIGPSERLRRLALEAMPIAVSPPRLREAPKPPAALSPLLGRNEDLARVLAWLERMDGSRLLTIAGPGGIGKTRLAQEIHRSACQFFGRRVWTVELGDVLEPERIGHAILEGLAILPSDDDPLDTLAASLPEEPSLLILDNFEQLVDGGAHWVKRALQENPNLVVVATSRRRLLIPGETEFPLGPLSSSGEHAPAVELFVRNAGAAFRDLPAAAATQNTIREIVDLLDGNPLAIKLAAGRAAVYSLADLRRLLPQDLDLLNSRDPNADPRHRHLRAAVRWSYDLLPPAHQAFAQNLIVFKSSWQAEDVARVLEEPRAADYLQGLIEHSFVQAEVSAEGVRLRLLATIRSFLESLVSADARAALSGHHARAFAAMAKEFAPQMLGPDALSIYGQIERLQEEYHEAIRWSMAHEPATALILVSHLWRYWSVRGRQWEALEWARPLLETTLPDSHTLSVSLFGVAHCAIGVGEAELAVRLYERNLAVATALGETKMVSMVEASLGELHCRKGEFALAAIRLEGALASLLARESRYEAGLCRDELAVAYIGLGRYDEAEAHLDEAAPILARSNDEIPLAYLTGHRGELALARGQFEAAEAHLKSAHATFTRYATLPGIAATTYALAEIALRIGDRSEAEKLLEASRQAYETTRDQAGLAKATEFKKRL